MSDVVVVRVTIIIIARIRIVSLFQKIWLFFFGREKEEEESKSKNKAARKQRKKLRQQRKHEQTSV